MPGTIGERVRALRKQCGLTLDEFAFKIGSTRPTVSRYELGQAEIPEMGLRAICREFRVRREWLETGEGDMAQPAPQDTVELLAQECNLSPLGRQFLEVLVTLTDDQLEVVRDLVFSMAKTLQPAADKPEEKPPDKPDEPSDPFSEDALREALEEQIAMSKRRKEESAAS